MRGPHPDLARTCPLDCTFTTIRYDYTAGETAAPCVISLSPPPSNSRYTQARFSLFSSLCTTPRSRTRTPSCTELQHHQVRLCRRGGGRFARFFSLSHPQTLGQTCFLYVHDFPPSCAQVRRYEPGFDSWARTARRSSRCDARSPRARVRSKNFLGWGMGSSSVLMSTTRQRQNPAESQTEARLGFCVILFIFRSVSMGTGRESKIF